MALTQVQGGMLAGSNNTTTTIQSNGTTAITINSSQNVGIGTSSPADKLSVVGSVRIESAGYFSMYNADNTTFSQIRDSGGAYVSQMEFYTAGAERMRITNGGELCVGVTSAFGGSIGNFKNSNNVVAVQRFGGTEGVCLNFLNTAGNSTGTIYNYNSGSTSYFTSSDYRLKDNIQPMTGALDKVSQLKPVTYNWKSTGELGQGFIAHELQAIVPDCVSGKKDEVQLVDIKDEEGNVIGQEEKPIYQGVDTSFLVATLTAAIQELKDIVDTQAAKIAELEAKVQ